MVYSGNDIIKCHTKWKHIYPFTDILCILPLMLAATCSTICILLTTKFKSCKDVVLPQAVFLLSAVRDSDCMISSPRVQNVHWLEMIYSNVFLCYKHFKPDCFTYNNLMAAYLLSLCRHDYNCTSCACLSKETHIR